MAKYQTYAEYKDSGVEWLGTVPIHWKILKTKHYGVYKSGDFISGDKIKTEGSFQVLGGNGLRGYTESFNIEGEHALIGRQGALCGNINYSYGRTWITEHAVVVYHNNKVNVKWLGEMFRVMNLNQYSMSAAQPGLAIENIINLTSILPPLPEQEKIANFLDHETAKIDTLIEKQQQQIKLLKERRTALISAAVTGKIDVRDWQAPKQNDLDSASSIKATDV